MTSIEVFLPVDNVVLHIGIAAVFEALAVYLYQFRKIPGAIMLVMCQICKGIWVVAKMFCGMNTDLPGKLFWARFTEWMPLLLIYFWFEFIWEVSQPKKILAPLRYIIRGIVTVLVLIIAFDGWLGWYYGAMELVDNVLTVAFGPLAWFTMFFCYALNVLCLGLSASWIYSTQGLRRQQAIVLSITPLFNFFGNVLGHVAALPMVSPQTIGQLLSAVYVTWVFYRWRVYSILPLAQEAVTKSMIDGLLVIDEKGYIVDMNPAAKILFNGLPVAVGDSFQQAAAAWPQLADLENSGAEGSEAAWNLGRERRFFQIDTIPLTTPQRHVLGKTLVFKDITEQKQAQETILETEKAFSILSERERLGRELHDGPSQMWNYFHLELQTLRTLLRNGQQAGAQGQVEKLIGVVKKLNTDARESIVGLKMTADSGTDFFANLREYLAWYEDSYGIVCQLSVPGEAIADLFTPVCEVQLLRIIQEALTNIRKHARATHVQISIVRDNRKTFVRITDDGCGFALTAIPAEQKSFGLKIMQERAVEAGGRLEVQSIPGKGTTIQVEFFQGNKEQSER